MEQRSKIKFCFKLGKSATETYDMIKTVYGNEALCRTNDFMWFSKFRDGRESIEDVFLEGHPMTCRTEENLNKVAEVLTNEVLESDSGIQYFTHKNLRLVLLKQYPVK